MGERVLLAVEDNDADFFIIQLAAKEAPIALSVHRARDGEEALAFVQRCGEYLNAPRPGLILLDWNLPRMSGGEFLTEMRAQEHLRSIPVVVFTCSRCERSEAIALGAQDYVTKPSTLPGVMDAVKTICSRLATP